MVGTTIKDIMDELHDIEIIIKLEKFLTLGLFMISIGLAIFSMGFSINNNVMTIFGILTIFIGIVSGLIYHVLKIEKEIKRR